MLGKLEKVDLRTVWKNEAQNFTKWLAKPENISLLSDEIGIDIEPLQTEAQVGKFNVDILAQIENTDKTVIIENQLETTNHDHLGKLITYASGHDAEIIIWIVKEVRDEHRQAIDWLNEHTDDKANFFAVKLELWQIGDSPPAAKFQVISRPNDWAKAIKKAKTQPNMTDTKIMQLEFWSQFREYIQNNGAKLRLRKPSAQHWYDVSYGSSQSHISLSMDTRKSSISCEIYIPDSKGLFKQLFEHKTDIEKELDKELEWMELPKRKACRIKLSKSGDLSANDNWENHFEWLKDQAEKFQHVFSQYVQKTTDK